MNLSVADFVVVGTVQLRVVAPISVATAWSAADIPAAVTNTSVAAGAANPEPAGAKIESAEVTIGAFPYPAHHW